MAQNVSVPTRRVVEVQILQAVYDAAKAMRQHQDEQYELRGEDNFESMAWLGRQIIKLAGEAASNETIAVRMLTMPPADRASKPGRQTFRFRISAAEYAKAVGALAHAQRLATSQLGPGVKKEQGKRSVARWIEYHLDRYGRTGSIR